jgi:hypothetical protein
VIMHHNEIKDELCDLLSKALVPSSAVHDEPIIYPCRPIIGTPAKEPHPVGRINSLVDDCKDILVCGFWAHIMDCISIEGCLGHEHMFESRTPTQNHTATRIWTRPLLDTNERRRTSTLSHVSSNGATSLHSWSLWMDFKEERQLSSFSNFPPSSLKDGIR